MVIPYISVVIPGFSDLPLVLPSFPQFLCLWREEYRFLYFNKDLKRGENYLRQKLNTFQVNMLQNMTETPKKYQENDYFCPFLHGFWILA